jgi:hypothetical protein
MPIDMVIVVRSGRTRRFVIRDYSGDPQGHE